MTDRNHIQDRDEVLFAFHEACSRPTADDIITWTHRFPQFADDIRAHAAASRDHAAREGFAVPEPDETMLARGFSIALNALHNAEEAARSTDQSSSSVQSFYQMAAARSTDVPQLARDLDIDRSVLAALFNGWMTPPIGRRLVNTLVAALLITRDAFDRALQAALRAPRLGYAKAQQAPTIIPRSYAEIIRDSSMPPERQRFWVEED
jgi:hypothetical protein